MDIHIDWGMRLECRLAGSDLGVLVDGKPNMSHIKPKRANHILGCIKDSIANWSKAAIAPKHSMLVRPHLKCCVQFWAPQCKDIKTLEHVQRSATKMLKELEDMTYEELLRILGLFSLEKRRLKPRSTLS